MASQNPIHPWLKLSIPAGNALQWGGLLGAVGLVLAARRRATHRGLLLVLSWFLAYFTGHAFSHWVVGRLGGIRFTGYGLHGSTAVAGYPPGMRAIFAHLPFLSARTEPVSRRAASPLARAAMYAAGPAATILTSIGIPLVGEQAGIPGARLLRLGASLWIAGMFGGELFAPRSDLRRAWRALREHRIKCLSADSVVSPNA